MSEKAIRERLSRQLAIYNQEKIHLQLDKPHYVTGEKIWFRAFLVDALSHQPATNSRYIYVELINPQDSIVGRVMIRPDSTDVFQGYIPISENISSGNYSVRAYTRLLENLGDEYFYRKRVQITNPLQISLNQATTYIPERNSDFEVSFFPEGGNWPQDLNWRIAFKATNSSGWYEDIKGYIVNEQEDTLARFESSYQGLGVFSLVATQGNSYYAICKNEKGVTKRIKLPESSPDLISLKAAQAIDKVVVSVEGNTTSLQAPLYVLIHTRGILHYVQPWDPDKKQLFFKKKDLPSGILQILLINEHAQPISERLVYCLEDDMADVTPVDGFRSYNCKEKASFKLKITDKQGNALQGNFSVAVTCDQDILPDTTTSILSSILLTSEFKGFKENPDFYFQYGNRRIMTIADMLMMTEVWSRYNWQDILAGTYHTPSIAAETGYSLSGKIKKAGKKKSNKDEGYLLRLTADEDEKHFSMADEEGYFVFDGFEYPDSTLLSIQLIYPEIEAKNVELKLLPFVAPTLSPIPLLIPDTTLINENKISYISKAHHQQVNESAMRNVLLDNVEVNAQRKSPETPKVQISSFYGQLGEVKYTYQNRGSQNFTNIVSIIRRFFNVQVVENLSEELQVPQFLYNRTPMVIIVDDMFMPLEFDIRSINVNDIESLSLIRSGSKGSAIIATHGSAAIVITTKRGNTEYVNPPRVYPTIQTTPLGYQKPIEFQAPDYEAMQNHNIVKPDLRSTIYWNPCVGLNENGEASFSFYTAGQPSDYSIVVEGVSADGAIISFKERISVE